MLEDLFDIFERDKRSSSRRPGGLRGRLTTLLGSDGDDRRSYDRERDRSDRDDDDDDDDRRYAKKGKRERDLFDVGD